MKKKFISVSLLFVLGILVAACAQGPIAAAPATLQVLAAESFLADIAQNVAGERAQVQSLVPAGQDAHVFEPTPQDIALVTRSQVLIINGAGFEAWLAPLLENAGGERLLVEASAGLELRHSEEEHLGEEEHAHAEGDPHFWLDPISVITYVENIRDGLSQADPAGAEEYTRNAAAYIEELKALDTWIIQQVSQIPPERRLLVTNHETFGYFAERYGFTVVGTVIPGISSAASPSALQMTALVDAIHSAGVRAIFLETGSNTQLAEQLASETGVIVVSDLHTHSLTGPDGAAPTYLAMLRHNVTRIVESLK